MRVRMLRTEDTPMRVYRVGVILNLPDDQALRLIDAGAAERLDGPDAPRQPAIEMAAVEPAEQATSVPTARPRSRRTNRKKQT